MAYRIKDWCIFETAKTINVDVKSYGTYPLKQGVGFRRLMARPDGICVYGAFMLLVSFCHQHKKGIREGWLTEDGLETGQAIEPEDLCFRYGGKLKDWQNALDVLSDPNLKINWLTVHGESKVKKTQHEIQQRTKASKQSELEHVAIEIYKLHPRKVGKPKALNAITKAIESGVSVELLKSKTQSYADAVAKWDKSDRQFIKHASTWFNGQHWEDDEESWERDSGTNSKPKTFRDEGFNSLSERNSLLDAWSARYAKATSAEWPQLLAKAQAKFGESFAQDMVERARQ